MQGPASNLRNKNNVAAVRIQVENMVTVHVYSRHDSEWWLMKEPVNAILPFVKQTMKELSIVSPSNIWWSK